VIEITPQMRLLLAVEPVDFRKGIDGLCQKRLSQGRFGWWPAGGQQPTLGLDVHKLQLLLWNGNPNTAQAAPLWRPIASAA